MDKRLETHRDFKDSEVVKAEEFLETMKPFCEIARAICLEINHAASLIIPFMKKSYKDVSQKMVILISQSS